MTATFLTVKQIAQQHNIPKRTVQHNINVGKLKAHKLPGVTGTWLVTPEDLEEWLTKRCVCGSKCQA
jgi:excisionase family DNA binding protein